MEKARDSGIPVLPGMGGGWAFYRAPIAPATSRPMVVLPW